VNALPAILNGQQLPDGWNAIAVRWLSRRYSGGTPDKNLSYYWNDGTIPWLNSGAVNQGVIRQPSDFITEEGFANSSAKWMPRGSVVMALAGQGKTKAMVGYLDIDATGNQSLAAIVPSAIDGKFLYWWLTSQYRHIRNLSSQDGRDGLNLEMLGNIRCPVPPLKAQQHIAAYLDQKTAQIDGLITKKQVLLERLAEKRQAIITRAVTKGLNPTAPMKDSGIGWLGQIPAHWEVSPLKRLTSIWGRIGFRGYTVNDIVNEGEGALSLSPSNIVGDRISFDTKTHISWEKYHESPEIKVQINDILFVKTGSTIGKVCLVTERPEPMTVNPQVVVLKVHAANPLFLSAAMSSTYFSHQVKGYIFGGSTPAMTQYNLGSLSIAAPPAMEQENIAGHITRAEDQILNTRRKVEGSIRLLAEYRSALIIAAVTGAIEELR
jgi:type I restriction enzyme S subunit